LSGIKASLANLPTCKWRDALTSHIDALLDLKSDDTVELSLVETQEKSRIVTEELKLFRSLVPQLVDAQKRNDQHTANNIVRNMLGLNK
jgi:hypothetical protein